MDDEGFNLGCTTYYGKMSYGNLPLPKTQCDAKFGDFGNNSPIGCRCSLVHTHRIETIARPPSEYVMTLSVRYVSFCHLLKITV